VLEIRFAGAAAPVNDEVLWRSTLFALLEGASEALGIPRDDIDGTVYPYNGAFPPALVLYDNVPGGAGHVRRAAEPAALRTVMTTALQRVSSCECGPESSCYQCLRNYYNQYYHDMLVRGRAADFLEGVS
jgi:ATP-dependent helicase YprA (DUF1998 family)